jgi:uncharacterized membrane protein
MVIAAKKTSQVLLHMGVAFSVMYVVTGSVAFGGLAAVIEPICNVLLLPLHDNLWERLANKRPALHSPASYVPARIQESLRA